jgi:hypothetical protein
MSFDSRAMLSKAPARCSVSTRSASRPCLRSGAHPRVAPPELRHQGPSAAAQGNVHTDLWHAAWPPALQAFLRPCPVVLDRQQSHRVPELPGPLDALPTVVVLQLILCLTCVSQIVEPAAAEQSTSLVEIGPRMTLQLIRVFDGRWRLVDALASVRATHRVAAASTAARSLRTATLSRQMLSARRCVSASSSATSAVPPTTPTIACASLPIASTCRYVPPSSQAHTCPW